MNTKTLRQKRNSRIANVVENQTLLQDAERLDAFVKQQKQRTKHSDRQKQWKLQWLELQKENDVRNYLRSFKLRDTPVSNLIQEFEKAVAEASIEDQQLQEVLSQAKSPDQTDRKNEDLKSALAAAIQKNKAQIRDRLLLEKELRGAPLIVVTDELVENANSLKNLNIADREGKHVVDKILYAAKQELQVITDSINLRLKKWKQQQMEIEKDSRKDTLTDDEKREFKALKRTLSTKFEDRHSFVKHISSVLPRLSERDIAAFDSWWHERQRITATGHALHSEFKMKSENLLFNTRAALETVQKDFEAKWNKIEQSANTRVNQSLKQSELRQKQTEREKYKIKIRIEETNKQRDLDELLIKQQHKRAALKEDARNKLAIYRRNKQEKHLEKKQAAVEALRVERRRRRLRQRYNKSRVTFRRLRLRDKAELLRALAKQKEVREEQRKVQLNKITSSLCWKSERDVVRTQSHTTSSRQRITTDPQETQNAFNPVFGFTVDHLLTDLRFKIHEALISYGLHKNKFAPEVLQYCKDNPK